MKPRSRQELRARGHRADRPVASGQALLPIIEGMQLDVVRARMRQGQHNVERVTSMKVRRGKLIEVERRNVSARGTR